MRIIAIIVTYNRLSLLKKCMLAIAAQTRKPDAVIVINNSSTDGTQQWLEREKIHFVTFENKGGAAGFSNGIRLAYQEGADWIWLMDDDSIPEKNALQYLEEGVEYFADFNLPVGFFASHAVWTDGNTHLMNKTYEYDLKKEMPAVFFESEGKKYKAVVGATFVSLLLSRKAVEKVGLPLKEFFIWCDDVEYTRRIIAADMWGVFVEKSKVVHETPANYFNNIYKDSAKNIWKYNYGMRNELYTRKIYKSKSSFYRNVLKRVIIWPFLILAKRKDNKISFIKMVWRTSFAALTFHPKIERVNDKKE